MVNKKMLLAELVLAGYSQRSFADAINMNKNVFNLKVNGKSEFNTDEVKLICEKLNITDCAKKCAIFLQ